MITYPLCTPPSSRLVRSITFGLVVLTLLVFLPVVRNDFVLYDDQEYITTNPRIRQGITVENLSWAFTTCLMGNWHPVTWLSHLTDGQLYGLDPAGHHVTSLLLHVATTVALFLVLWRMTGNPRCSSLVAALFAIHPLHVESVAWASERKDVLAGFFWVLTMAAYLRFAHRPGFRRYVLVLGCFALGLMSKALLVTLPFLLLVMDFWPLGRWQRRRDGPASQSVPRTAGRLFLEKAPLFGLAAALSVITFYAQVRTGAVSSITQNTPMVRIGNALLSYLLYLGKTLWPTNLSVFYPYHMSRVSAWIAVAVLAALTGLVFWRPMSRPHLIAGWLWFLGTLVPMIGLVQVGSLGIADRYTYIPLIGIFLMVTWEGAHWARRAPFLRRPAAVAAAILLTTLATLSFRQAAYWRNTVTLFRHALVVTPDNYNAKVLLGMGLSKEGKLEEANDWYRSALENNSRFKQLNSFIGINLFHRGRLEEAMEYLLKETEIDPESVSPHIYLGTILGELGRNEEAKRHYREVLRLEPNNARILTGLGVLHSKEGLWSEALACFQQALRIKPDDAFAQAKAQEAALRLRANQSR